MNSDKSTIHINLTFILITSLLIGSFNVNNMFNSLSDDKILDWTELKAFADDKYNAKQNAY